MSNEVIDRASLNAYAAVDDKFDSDKFIKMRLRICHDGDNPNGSHFELADMERAQETLVNIPILANVVFDKNGDPQFGGHDINIERNKLNEDELRFVYKETPIGVIPENCNAQIEEYEGRNYVCADGYIWRDYSNYAEDIIERDGEIKISMEIGINASTFDEDRQIYNITDYVYKGVTFLGNQYGTGMIDARATTNYSDNQQQMIMIMEELKQVLEQYSQTKRGENEMGTDKTIENEGTVFTDDGSTVTAVKTELDTATAPAASMSTEGFSEPITLEPAGTTVTFRLSHDDIREKLYQKLWATTDVDVFRWISNVYDDMFEYSEENNSGEVRFYRQKYSVANDEVTFDGDRIEVFIRVLTAEEVEALDNLNSSYEILKTENEKLTAENTELQEFKKQVVSEQHNSEITEVLDKWSEKLAGNTEFENIREMDFSGMTVSDVETRCKVIYADMTVTFGNTKKSVDKESVVKFSLNTEKQTERKPYNGIVEQYL